MLYLTNYLRQHTTTESLPPQSSHLKMVYLHRTQVWQVYSLRTSSLLAAIVSPTEGSQPPTGGLTAMHIEAHPSALPCLTEKGRTHIALTAPP